MRDSVPMTEACAHRTGIGKPLDLAATRDAYLSSVGGPDFEPALTV